MTPEQADQVLVHLQAMQMQLGQALSELELVRALAYGFYAAAVLAVVIGGWWVGRQLP